MTNQQGVPDPAEDGRETMLLERWLAMPDRPPNASWAVPSWTARLSRSGEVALQDSPVAQIDAATDVDVFIVAPRR